MMRTLLVSFALLFCAPEMAMARTAMIHHDFISTGADRRAIQAVLRTYALAVTTKNQPMFESIILNKDIPFSDPIWTERENGTARSEQNYERFRKAVFEGASFSQRFVDVKIHQFGSLADVSLVYINSTKDSSSWGWKTLQLIKIDGNWKIASEFFVNNRR